MDNEAPGPGNEISGPTSLLSRTSRGRPGRPAGPTVVEDLRKLCRLSTDRGHAALMRVIENPDSSDAAVVAAVSLLWAYGWGKPVSQVEISGQSGGPVQTMDLGRLSQEELRTMLELTRKASGE